MSHRRRRWILTVAICGYLLAIWLCRPIAVAQEKAARPGAAETKGDRFYYGISACGQAGGCHDAEQPRYDDKNPLLCRCNEMTLWKAHDKHADAYQVLLGERGQQMLKALGYKSAKDATACLTCHAVVLKDGEKAHSSFSLEEGVSCVVCHGPYARWVRYHVSPLDREEYRKLSAAEKETDYGMTNLRDPLRRSKICLSCHVGNAEENKIVTHEMYAAGHPPLPGFEVAAFCAMMPPHWEPRSRKPEKIREIVGYDGKTREQAKLVLVGAAVGLGEYLRLVTAQAGECLATDVEDKKVLDWSNFDCWSCHHELKSPAWRQVRGYPGKPGRVPAKTWPAELLHLGLDHLGENPTEFDRLWDEVQAAFVAKQFGDNARIVKSAGKLAEWTDKLAQRLNDSTIDGAAASRLLVKLSSLPRSMPDYDSARQLGWAYRTIWEEQNAKTDAPESLMELDELLGLRFSPGRMQSGDREGVIVRGLPKSLNRLNGYDPEAFLRLWRALHSTRK